MQKTNKIISRLFLALCLIAGISILSPYCGIKAEAASGYKEIANYDSNKKIITSVGDWGDFIAYRMTLECRSIGNLAYAGVLNRPVPRIASTFYS